MYTAIRGGRHSKSYRKPYLEQTITPPTPATFFGFGLRIALLVKRSDHAHKTLKERIYFPSHLISKDKSK